MSDEELIEELERWKKVLTIGGAIKPYELVKAAIIVSQAVLLEYPMLEAKTKKLQGAIRGILENPQGCPMCDAGILRNPEKAHWDDCPYEIARKVLEDPHV